MLREINLAYLKPEDANNIRDFIENQVVPKLNDAVNGVIDEFKAAFAKDLEEFLKSDFQKQFQIEVDKIGAQAQQDIEQALTGLKAQQAALTAAGASISAVDLAKVVKQATDSIKAANGAIDDFNTQVQTAGTSLGQVVATTVKAAISV